MEISCTIEYTEYSALFNEPLWKKVSGPIEKELTDAARKFMQSKTINVLPP